MVDLHSHVLFGIDDGARNMEESLEMIEAAEKAGIRTIVATPHLKNYVLAPEKTHENYRMLAEKIKGDNIGIILGFEIMLNHLLEKAPDVLGKYDVGGTGYLLIEIPYTNYREQSFKMLDDLLRQYNYRIIIAHPERMGSGFGHKKAISRLRKMGFLIQVNTGSILGFYGEGTRKLAKYVIENGLADFVASDAHRAESYSWHEQAYASVVKWSDEAYAERLFRENGRKLLGNKWFLYYGE
ncbi:MAG: hypothetical protein GX754_01230 [Clostridiaceae bacterium]|nr:hypothetical protein [Clostridiaceae bacterium]